MSAAFRRLCVETKPVTRQKQDDVPAAFRRLCVETGFGRRPRKSRRQPPSGGCVLKRGRQRQTASAASAPAAFRRLCVETIIMGIRFLGMPPAAFRRLCVETSLLFSMLYKFHPAAFRRLCVETRAER